MHVIVDNLLTNYQLHGNGELLLWLHGWGDNANGSMAMQRELSKMFTVLAPDLPGFGQTQAPPEAWDLDNYMTFVDHLLLKLNLDQPKIIVGHSNGGALAIRATANKVFTPQKLILIDAAGMRNKGRAKRAALLVSAKTGNVLTKGLPSKYRTILRRHLYASAGSDMLVVESLRETFAKTVRQDVQADAATINIPTLLIYGADDLATPVNFGRRYAQLIINSKLIVIPDAGHFVYLDQPVKVLNAVQEFLA